MTTTAKYIGPRHELRGHHALIQHDRVGYVKAQFTSVPPELGDPDCLRKDGPHPQADDLRFGWHPFASSEFKADEPVIASVDNVRRVTAAHDVDGGIIRDLISVEYADQGAEIVDMSIYTFLRETAHLR